MKNSLRLTVASMALCFGLFSITHVKAASISYADQGTPVQNSYTFTATTTGYIGAYFQESSAAYTNALSLLVNGVVTPQSSMGVLNNQTSNVGDYVNLGYVNAGDILTFQLKVLDTGDIWNSNSASNADGVNHIYSTGFSGDTVLGIPAGTYVGFEDVHGGGDFDYNDQAFIFTNISTLAEKHISPVPEPETYSMLLIGLGLVAFTVHSRKRRM
ncbi:DUF4114 domain-containing protein [Nitrosomonas ureae]|uniref:PEP-CTERM protein-sorting domain-containing protein n=1 Tax=Nitrosomonas ureae TaxID=44577 RepID=A0A1H5T7F9_9PROT|nr:DUF4114 domain-containing protein [Nitrosomonas ureae]SEF58773.1 PEP-CTERM protein-sorting domain-containing protein [Nitrosomonas ureae]